MLQLHEEFGKISLDQGMSECALWLMSFWKGVHVCRNGLNTIFNQSGLSMHSTNQLHYSCI